MPELKDSRPVVATVYPWLEPLWDQLHEERDRNTHALMMAGGSGLGKADFALAYTRQLVIRGSADPTQAESLFDAGTHPDVHVLIPEERIIEDGGLVDSYALRYKEQHTGKPRTVITIDQVRKLSNTIITFAHSSGVKIVLIFDADLMNRNAANALLKSLEEPPTNTLFVLVTDHPEKTPMTIRSRCSMVVFRVPDRDVALNWLKTRPGMEEGAATWLSMAGGSPLLAQEMLESGYTELQIRIFKSVAALWNGKVSTSQVAGAWSGENSTEVTLTLQKLLADLSRFSLSEQPVDLYYPAQAEWLQRTAKQISLNKIMSAFDTVSYSRRLLDGPSDAGLLMENMAISVAGMVGD